MIAATLEEANTIEKVATDMSSNLNLTKDKSNKTHFIFLTDTTEVKFIIEFIFSSNK